MASVPEDGAAFRSRSTKVEATNPATSWIKLLQAVALAANTASSFEDAVRAALEEVCRRTGWPIGHVLRAATSEVLESTSIWYLEDPRRYNDFKKATDGLVFKGAEGLPGRARTQNRAVWLNDLSSNKSFLRREQALAAGLYSALAFPIAMEDQPVAVMEFFSDENVDPDPTFLEVMEHIGTLLGQAGEHRLIEQALVENEERTRRIIETAGDAFIEMDPDGVVTDWNKQAEKTFGWTREEIMGQLLCDTIIPPQYRDAHRQGLERYLATGEGPLLGRRVEISAIRRDGKEVPVELNLWVTDQGEVPRFNAFIHDISERQEARAALEEANKKLQLWVQELERRNREISELVETSKDLRVQTLRDPLTNLFNRRYMEESLDREIQRAARSESPMGLIMIDIDHFKKVNDTFGHEAGDLVLRTLGEFFQTHIRAGDIACRYGGEEFLLILPEAPLDATRERAEALWQSLKDVELTYEGKKLATPTLSFGVAVLPNDGETRQALLRAADAALYRAKASGRNRVVSAGELL